MSKEKNKNKYIIVQSHHLYSFYVNVDEYVTLDLWLTPILKEVNWGQELGFF